MTESQTSTDQPTAERLKAVWSPGPTVDISRLDDGDLGRHRHPEERRALVLIPIIVLVVGAALALLRPLIPDALNWAPRPIVGAVLAVAGPIEFLLFVAAVLAVLALVDVIGQWLQATDLLANGVEVTPTTFPQLYPSVVELRRRFGVPGLRVFVARLPGFFPSSIGVRDPYVIVLPSGLLGMLAPEELEFALGHEIGHIKLGHTRMSALLGGGHVRTPLPIAWLQKARSLLTASYQRAQELSADRIGVLATGDVGPAVSLAIKTGVGPPRGAKVDVPSLTEQAAELGQRTKAVAASLVQLSASQPKLIHRVHELTKWAGLPKETGKASAPAPSQAATSASTPSQAVLASPAPTTAEPASRAAPERPGPA